MSKTHHPHKDCLEMFEKLSEYLDQELDETTCREIEKHAEECIKCNVCLETLKRTIEICKQTESKPVPKDLSGRLRKLIENTA
jgi:hypothetical protein